MMNFLATSLARPAVVDWLIRRAARTPYTPIITDDLLYMERYWLFNPYPAEGGPDHRSLFWRLMPSARLHCIRLPDQDRHLHDHPWNARTFILRGGYDEVRPHRRIGGYFDQVVDFLQPDGMWHQRRPGQTTTLRFGEYHRIISVQPECWTLFVTGRKRGTWGFMVDGVKVPWRRYLGLEQAP